MDDRDGVVLCAQCGRIGMLSLGLRGRVIARAGTGWSKPFEEAFRRTNGLLRCRTCGRRCAVLLDRTGRVLSAAQRFTLQDIAAAFSTRGAPDYLFSGQPPTVEDVTDSERFWIPESSADSFEVALVRVDEELLEDPFAGDFWGDRWEEEDEEEALLADELTDYGDGLARADDDGWFYDDEEEWDDDSEDEDSD